MAEVPNFRLKLIFCFHFVLIVWVTLGHWCPLSYLFYNSILALLLLWGVHANTSEEPIQMAVVVNAASIIFDVIVLSLRYPNSHESGEVFSAAMAILNVVLRPFTTILLYRILQERNGSLGPLENVASIFGNNRSTDNYEDMDKQNIAPTTSQQDQYFYQPQPL